VSHAPQRHGGNRWRARGFVPLGEVAQRLGVSTRTVRSRQWRGELPAPRWKVGRRPEWSWREVEAWARGSGRT